MNFRAQQSFSSRLQFAIGLKLHRVSAIQLFGGEWKDNVRGAIVMDDTCTWNNLQGFAFALLVGKVTIIARQRFQMTPICRTIPLH